MRYLLLIISCVVTQIAEAQVRNSPQFGLGLGVGAAYGEVELPIRFEDFRLAPSVSYRSSEHESRSFYEYSGSTYYSTSRSTTLGLALGAYYGQPVNKDLSWYVGPKFGYQIASSSYKTHWDDSLADYYRPQDYEEARESFLIGLGLGVEYMISGQFSFGMHLHGVYEWDREPDYTPDQAGSYWSKGHSFSHESAFLVRWYFN